MKHSKRHLRQEVGFTLLEVLVVISMIAVLATLLLPALARVKAKSGTAKCLFNLRQLSIARMLYSDDFSGALPPNKPGGVKGARNVGPGWVIGWQDWTGWQENTNGVVISGPSALLSPYTGASTRVFKCPSDRFLSDAQVSLGWERRIRSYSMNGFLGSVEMPDFRTFYKQHDLNGVSPSFLWVFADEHPDSVNDPWFQVGMYSEWNDFPASYHGRATAIAYMDGHCHSQKWLDDFTVRPVTYNYIERGQPTLGTKRDLQWLQERSTIRR